MRPTQPPAWALHRLPSQPDAIGTGHTVHRQLAAVQRAAGCGLRAADDQVDAFAVEFGRVVQISPKSQFAVDQLIGVALGGFEIEIDITAQQGVVHPRTKQPQRGFGAKPPRYGATALRRYGATALPRCRAAQQRDLGRAESHDAISVVAPRRRTAASAACSGSGSRVASSARYGFGARRSIDPGMSCAQPAAVQGVKFARRGARPTPVHQQCAVGKVAVAPTERSPRWL